MKKKNNKKGLTIQPLCGRAGALSCVKATKKCIQNTFNKMVDFFIKLVYYIITERTRDVEQKPMSAKGNRNTSLLPSKKNKKNTKKVLTDTTKSVIIKTR